MDLAGKKIVLGLTGGIACYKAAELTRALIKAGASVQVVMTQAATQFITPVTMQALSGKPVYTDQWDARIANNMAHIDLSRNADAIVIAPCSTKAWPIRLGWRWQRNCSRPNSTSRILRSSIITPTYFWVMVA